jgi:hypothetical protein
MKRILLAVFFVLVLAPAAWAQAPFVPSWEFGVGGGLNIPQGGIGDGMNNGYNFNASVGYNVAPKFTIGAELGFWGSGASDETLALLGTGSEFNMSSVQFTAMAKYKMPVDIHHMYAKGPTRTSASALAAGSFLMIRRPPRSTPRACTTVFPVTPRMASS